MIEFKEAKKEEANEIAKTSAEVLKDLIHQERGDYFGGVCANDVIRCTQAESTAFVAVDENEIVGFLLCLKMEKSYCIYGYGVKPQYQCKGIGKGLMQKAKEYAIQNGVYTLTGTVYPENVASIKVLQSVSRKYSEGEEFVRHTKTGRTLRRKPFEIQL